MEGFTLRIEEFDRDKETMQRLIKALHDEIAGDQISDVLRLALCALLREAEKIERTL